MIMMDAREDSDHAVYVLSDGDFTQTLGWFGGIPPPEGEFKAVTVGPTGRDSQKRLVRA
jgi:hypothetical protein